MKEHIQNFSSNQIWMLEHDAVFTLGTAADESHIINAGQIPVIQTDRGGEVTYHGPGQLNQYMLSRKTTPQLMCLSKEGESRTVLYGKNPAKKNPEIQKFPENPNNGTRRARSAQRTQFFGIYWNFFSIQYRMKPATAKWHK